MNEILHRIVGILPQRYPIEGSLPIGDCKSLICDFLSVKKWKIFKIIFFKAYSLLGIIISMFNLRSRSYDRR